MSDERVLDVDRTCFCCHRRESRIDHPRVGRAGPVVAKRMRALMSWYRWTAS